jgi:hypothetical protein
MCVDTLNLLQQDIYVFKIGAGGDSEKIGKISGIKPLVVIALSPSAIAWCPVSFARQ